MYDLCTPVRWLCDVMESLAVSRKHHLPLHSATLLVGRILVGSGGGRGRKKWMYIATGHAHIYQCIHCRCMVYQ